MATHLIINLILGLAGNQIPVPAPLFTESEALPSPTSGSRDLYQTVVVRRALSEHSDLAMLNLSVRVRGGRVTVSGFVPSAVVANRVVQILESLRGISDVRSDLVVDTKGFLPVVPQGRLEESRPMSVEVRRNPVPDPNVQARLGTMPSPGAKTAGTVSRVLILPQSDDMTPMPPPASPAKDVGLLVAELIRTEPRFGAIRYAVVNGILRIDSDVDRELGMEFAKRVAKVPGVQRVQISGE